MGFKYINPGIFTGNNTSIVRSTSSTYTRTGCAFSTSETNSSYSSSFKLLTLNTLYEEVFGTFDVFIPSVSMNDSVYLDLSTNNSMPRTKITVSNNQNSKVSIIVVSQKKFGSYKTVYVVSGSTSYAINAIHTFHFHLINNTLLQFYVDGVLVTNRSDPTGASTNSNEYCPVLSFNTVGFFTLGAFYFSNIILSDSLITPHETIVEVPISSTSTNMTESSGVYTASSVGKYILQTPNKSSLVSSYPNHRVTGIATVAQPAYTNGTPTTIAGRESSLKHDSTVLTTSNVAGALSSWKANLAMSQIDSKQYGWEVIA